MDLTIEGRPISCTTGGDSGKIFEFCHLEAIFERRTITKSIRKENGVNSPRFADEFPRFCERFPLARFIHF